MVYSPIFRQSVALRFSEPEAACTSLCLMALNGFFFSNHLPNYFFNSFILLAFATSCSHEFHNLIMCYVNKHFLLTLDALRILYLYFFFPFFFFFLFLLHFLLMPMQQELTAWKLCPLDFTSVFFESEMALLMLA